MNTRIRLNDAHRLAPRRFPMRCIVSHPDLAEYRTRIPRSPAAEDFAVVQDEPLHRDDFIRFTRRLFATKGGIERPGLAEADGDGITFGGHTFDRQLHHEAVV